MNYLNYKTTNSLINFLTVQQCPNENDGCTQEDTAHPNESYRSGSGAAISKFLDNSGLYDVLFKLHSNDEQIYKLKSVIKEINEAKLLSTNFYDERRLHWLKFWSNKAIELYGDNAAISFS